jgi:hypothetical protein
MHWKELLNQSDDFLDDINNVKHFSLKGHPEYPSITELDEEEVLELLSEFVVAEGQKLTIQSLLQYAPIFEMVLIKKNLPSIYG